MNNDTDFETELRGQLRDATDGLHAPEGFWSDVARRGRGRLRRRRIAAGASTAVAVVALVAGVGMLMPSPAVPTIEPASPGEATDEDAASAEQAESEAEAQARAEAETRRDEVDARRLQAEREAAERAAAEAVQRREGLAPAEPLPPITGYGDFSGVDPFELDSYAVIELVARCVSDAGFDVELAPPGDGIRFNDTDPERNGLAAATVEACRAGLNLPDDQPTTQQQREIVYEYQIALRQCLIDEGLDLPPAASLEQFLSDQSWHPYTDVHDALDDSDAWTNPIGDWDEIQMRCPQQPVGGFGNWTPGDAVQPVETLPDLER